ncbi:zinc-dependent alcohol dehydrogenase [Pseudaestuariivita rosea]|uniref:zinc-dependent alcohol dehydrogenase n=1 Tax=Pseudaestuariivita rosea TaxID=2763263 RepID=UPI001ABB8254|nr:alcohol dehydrogenase catalytic domain-containing protein [Pseudaestuariivita rosea]
MRALVQTAPNALEMQEVSEPENNAIRVAFCGICGSDMHAYAGHDPRRPTPIVLGHEVAGWDSDGRPVTVNPLVTCGVCKYCTTGRDNLCPDRQILSMPPRPGGFAEVVSAPKANCVPVLDGIPLEAASLTEPIACGLHAVRLAMNIAPLGEAMVLGGGAIGLGAALSLRAMGADRVTVVEPNTDRAKRLMDLPDVDVLDSPVMADTVIDAVGIDATRTTAFSHVRPGGVIAHIGLGGGNGGFDPRYATLQEITFFGTYTYTADDFRDTAQAIFDGRLPVSDHLEALTETRPLEEGPKAFAELALGQVAAPKVLLQP